MKLGTERHPKTKMLLAALPCSLPAAVGHLELLWHFAAQRSPQGDIGKWTDAAIAEACGWEGDPVHFVACLLRARWLDKVADPIRLLVHDWQDHAPAWVKAKLMREGLLFLNPEHDTMPLALNTPDLDPGTQSPTLLSMPSHALPGQERETAPNGAKGVAHKNGKAQDPLWEAMLTACGIPLTAQITASARKAYNRALKDLREVGATPESIHAHALLFKRKWKEISITPTALARRWNEVTT